MMTVERAKELRDRFRRMLYEFVTDEHAGSLLFRAEFDEFAEAAISMIKIRNEFPDKP